jgi:hypothetical protein
MQKELGANEGTEGFGAKEESKRKAKESGKLMDTKHKDILNGISKQRINHARRHLLWITMGTRSSKGAVP